MNGRFENELKNSQKIKLLLNDLPNYVSDFYYVLQVSKESSSCKQYIYRIKHFLEYTNKDIKNISEYDIGNYFESIKTKNIKNGEIKETSFSYRKLTWSILNSFFLYLNNKNIIDDNPMKYISRPCQKDDVHRKYLNMDDLNSILNAVSVGAGNNNARSRQLNWKERDFLILYLLMNTGMRETALTEINISDINFDNGELYVTDKRNKKHTYIITEELKTVLLLWINKRKIILKNNKIDALFISKNKTRITPLSVSNIVKKYSKEGIGISISPHKLRAAFVTNYYEASGHDIKATMEAVGHSNINTTSLYITNKNNERKKAATFMSNNLALSIY